MAADVIGLMDFLKIPKAAIVGWSDGAIIGLDIAMHHPERASKLFAFAANSDPSGVADIGKSPVFNAFIARAQKEYEQLSPTPGQYKAFLAQITKMWETQPNWTAADLNRIAMPTWIVDADHDEAIKRENTEFMAANIPDAGLLLQPQVSHFSFLQDSGVHRRRDAFPAAREGEMSGGRPPPQRRRGGKVDIYHAWCNLKPGVSDIVFSDRLAEYMNHLKAEGLIENWRLTRRKLGLGAPGLGEFHIMIEMTNLGQLDATFDRVAGRQEPVEGFHFAVNSLVANPVFALYRDFPDPVRHRGEERF